MGTAMRYAKLEVLSDTPQRKFLCIRIAEDKSNSATSRKTQICNIPLSNAANVLPGLITVVIKGAQLPANVVEQIVRDYVNGTLQLHQDALFQIVDD